MACVLRLTFAFSVKGHFDIGKCSVKVVLFMSGDIIIINMRHPCCMSLCSASESISGTSTGASESPLGPGCIE